MRVGVLAGTTGEARLLDLTNLTGADAVLAVGTQTETDCKVLIADGSAAYSTRASGSSAAMEDWRRLHPLPMPSLK